MTSRILREPVAFAAVSFLAACSGEGAGLPSRELGRKGAAVVWGTAVRYWSGAI